MLHHNTNAIANVLHYNTNSFANVLHYNTNTIANVLRELGAFVRFIFSASLFLSTGSAKGGNGGDKRCIKSRVKHSRPKPNQSPLFRWLPGCVDGGVSRVCRGEGVEWGVGLAPVSLTQPVCVYVGVPARPLTSGELKFPHSKMCGDSCVYNFPEFRGALGVGGVGFRGGEAARERSLFWEAGEDAAGLSLVLELFACEWVSGLLFFR